MKELEKISNEQYKNTIKPLTDSVGIIYSTDEDTEKAYILLRVAGFDKDEVHKFLSEHKVKQL